MTTIDALQNELERLDADYKKALDESYKAYEETKKYPASNIAQMEYNQTLQKANTIREKRYRIMGEMIEAIKKTTADLIPKS